MPKMGKIEKVKTSFGSALAKLSPSARKAAIAKEPGNNQVVRNEYSKAVDTGRFDGTIEEFAKKRGMILRK